MEKYKFTVPTENHTIFLFRHENQFHGFGWKIKFYSLDGKTQIHGFGRKI